MWLAYVIGVVLFALGILVSVSLHEAGHMGTAKMFGMRVSRYFVGFGPTLWSFRKGETEYGFKGIPLGGFVKISGMTQQEEQEEQVPPEEQHRVFWRKPLWQRTIVLFAGSVTHFILGFVILWIMASFVSAPNPAYAADIEDSTDIEVAECLPRDVNQVECEDDDPESPAGEAGLQDGDELIAVAGTDVAGEKCAVPEASDYADPDTWSCAVLAIRDLPADEPQTSPLSAMAKGWTSRSPRAP